MSRTLASRMARSAFFLVVAVAPHGGFAQAPAAAQPAKPQTIDLATAKTMAAAAEREALKANAKVGIAVVDSNGDLVYSERLDGASTRGVTSAQGKARAALLFGQPTKQVQDVIASGKPVQANITLPAAGATELVINQGGLPILKDGKVIGGIGVGGSASSEDERFAQAGLDAASPARSPESSAGDRAMKAGFLSFLLCLAAAFALPAVPPADASRGLLLVLEKAQNNLVIIDPVSLQILARVPVGNDPHEVVASDDGKIAYISNYERGAGRTIARVDLVTQKALSPIDLGALSAPHGLAYAGGKLYFTAEGAKAVCRWDPVTEKVDWIMGTGKNRTHMVLVSKDLKTVFTSDDGSATVSFIEQPAPAPAASETPAAAPGANVSARRGPASSLWNIDTVAVGPRSEGFALSPDGKELWIANAQQSTISIIDVHERKIVQTIPSAKAVNRIRFSPDGKYVLVPDTGGEELLLIDAAARKEYKRIKLPGNSEGVVVAPDGRFAYTTLNSRDGVAVIDLRTMTVVNEIKTGKGPDGLAWAARN